MLLQRPKGGWKTKKDKEKQTNILNVYVPNDRKRLTVIDLSIFFFAGEALYLNQRFAGKDATGSYISIVTTINGTMPNINADARVQVNSFKELYKREERGRVESNGAVTYSVDGQAKSFIVQQIIAYNDPRGCHIDIYTFNVESKLLLSKYDADQGYTGIAIKTSIVNGSLREGK